MIHLGILIRMKVTTFKDNVEEEVEETGKEGEEGGDSLKPSLHGMEHLEEFRLEDREIIHRLIIHGIDPVIQRIIASIQDLVGILIKITILKVLDLILEAVENREKKGLVETILLEIVLLIIIWGYLLNLTMTG